MALEQFVDAYIQAALWSSTGEDGEPLDGLYTSDDLAPEALKEMREDCEDFYNASSDLFDYEDPCFSDDELAGHDFWLTRNRHSAGFWDRGIEHGDKLTEMAHAYGECYLYVGDDGRIHHG